MKPVKDRHLDAPGEANRDKHINFLAEEMGDVDPADEQFNDKENNTSENSEDVDNGFFTDDNNELQTEEENKNDKSNHPPAKNGKVFPAEPNEEPTLPDKITVANKNEDILTPVKDDEQTSYTNNKHQAG
jgi:hypothetical protein